MTDFIDELTQTSQDIMDAANQLVGKRGNVNVMHAGRGTGKTWFMENLCKEIGMPESLQRVMHVHDHAQYVAAYRFGVRKLTDKELMIAVPVLAGYRTSLSYLRQEVQYMLKVGVLTETGKDKDAPKHEDRIFVRRGKLGGKCMQAWRMFECL